MEKVAIKEWFTNKIDLGYGKRLSSRIGEVARETEKAYLVTVEWYSVDGEYEGVQNVWVPKKCTTSVEEYEAEEQAAANRYLEGCLKYEALVNWAKANNVKGVRSGMRKETILRKISECGLAYNY